MKKQEFDLTIEGRKTFEEALALNKPNAVELSKWMERMSNTSLPEGKGVTHHVYNNEMRMYSRIVSHINYFNMIGSHNKKKQVIKALRENESFFLKIKNFISKLF